jgi:hypothetical protein
MPHAVSYSRLHWVGMQQRMLQADKQRLRRIIIRCHCF